MYLFRDKISKKQILLNKLCVNFTNILNIHNSFAIFSTNYCTKNYYSEKYFFPHAVIVNIFVRWNIYLFNCLLPKKFSVAINLKKKKHWYLYLNIFIQYLECFFCSNCQSRIIINIVFSIAYLSGVARVN